MNTGIDEYFFDEVYSSPAPDTYEHPQTDFVLPLPSPNFANLTPYDAWYSPRSSSNASPFKGLDLNPPLAQMPLLSDIPLPQKTQTTLTPKPKKDKTIFQPFLSFDATEFTVQALKQRIGQQPTLF